jgi:hypothetical protein
VTSVTKTTKFSLKPKTSLEDKVYPKTYYHHRQTYIKVDEALVKIQVKNLHMVG